MDFDSLRNGLQWLRSEDGAVSAQQAIQVLQSVLQPLFEVENLVLFAPQDPRKLSVDLFAATKSSDSEFSTSVAIEYEHHGAGKPIDIDQVKKLVADASETPYERAMLIGRFGFTKAAREEAAITAPVRVELLDLSDIGAWIGRVEVGQPAYAREVTSLVRALSQKLVALVASDPAALDCLEWRDLERMMAEVMRGLGFDCELTASSKDGGKDLILNWTASTGEQSFLVELRHWRCGKRVGVTTVSDFVEVVVREKREGGLVLSTSGYTADAIASLAEFSRHQVSLGGRKKIALLARTYMRACSGIWSPPEELPELLFDARGLAD